MLLRPVYPEISTPRVSARLLVRPELREQEAEAVYRDEMAYPFDNYFGRSLRFQGLRALDLGCYCGGRAVAWAEKYRLAHISGIDIDPVMIRAAQEFAQLHAVDSCFRVGVAESIPFESESFDLILTFDVLEDVQDLTRAMAECYRVLKPGGHMYLVFPQYLHPTEHHLCLVSTTPGLHYFFSGRSLVRVYNSILRERGESARWYGRRTEELQPWEKCNTINGTSIRQFDQILASSGFITLQRLDPPIFSVGRRFSGKRSFAVKLAETLARPASKIPLLREIFTHRITRVLRKPGS